MEAEYIENSVKKRLILAGITELEESGVDNFSLRRVAVRAQVSCAAPYRHFKDKDELIEKIVEYIKGKRELFCNEIVKLFEADRRRLVIELSVANLRFWLANPNFRSVLLLSVAGGGGGVCEVDRSLFSAVENYCSENGVTDFLGYLYTVRALIYGTVVLAGAECVEQSSKNVSLFKNRIEEIFK